MAQNIIVGLDFDGTIAYGHHLRVEYARKFYGVNLTLKQTLHKNWPKQLGEERFRQMVRVVESEYMMMQNVAPGCKEVLNRLYMQGFRFAVITARILSEEEVQAGLKILDVKRMAAETREKNSVVKFITHHQLPIDYLHFTNQDPKKVLCGRLRARAFIDDDLKYLLPLAETFVKPFFIRQPWNEDESTPPKESGVVTVSNWLQFERWMLYMKEMHEAICYFNGWENAYYNLQKIAGFWINRHDVCLRHLEDYRKQKSAAAVR